MSKSRSCNPEWAVCASVRGRWTQVEGESKLLLLWKTPVLPWGDDRNISNNTDWNTAAALGVYWISSLLNHCCRCRGFNNSVSFHGWHTKAGYWRNSDFSKAWVRVQLFDGDERLWAGTSARTPPSVANDSAPKSTHLENGAIMTGLEGPGRTEGRKIPQSASISSWMMSLRTGMRSYSRAIGRPKAASEQNDNSVSRSPTASWLPQASPPEHTESEMSCGPQHRPGLDTAAAEQVGTSHPERAFTAEHSRPIFQSCYCPSDIIKWSIRSRKVQTFTSI